MSTLQNLIARSRRRSARGDDYAGVDIKQAQRVGALLGVVGILVAVPLMLVVPPTERVGAIGYAVEGTCRTPGGSAITITCGVAGLSRETVLDDLVATADADLRRRKAMPTEARLT